MSYYKIDKNVPVPEPGGVRKTKFPFHNMVKGDSFYVSITDATPEAVRAAASKFKSGGYVFTVRRDKTGCRCWRVS